MDFVGVIFRWLHIASAMFLLGSALFGKLVLSPAAAALDPKARGDFDNRVAAKFRGLVLVAIIVLVGSGLYNFLTKASFPPGYHMWFGIKALLALHVIAVSILLGKPNVDSSKRSRWMAGIAISGLAILGISAYLRALQA